MGRKRWTTRRTVEQCSIFLSVVWLHRSARLFNRAPGSSTTLTLRNHFNGALLARIDCELHYHEHQGWAILIRANDAKGAAMNDGQTIPIVTTRPHFGGERFWFKCECGRRVAKLYLPLFQKEFCCRWCYNLTYRSAQTHHSGVNFLARHPAELLKAFRSPKTARCLLAIKAALRYAR